MEIDSGSDGISSTAGAQSPSSLSALSIHAFLDFLEAECAMLVTMVMRDSPYWLKAKACLMESMKNMVDSTLTVKNAGQVRQILYQEILNGRYPSGNMCNSHCLSPGAAGQTFRLDSSFDDDDGEASGDLDKIKRHGRRCCSPCCAGAFLVETMLSVMVHQDLEELVFPSGLTQKIYKRKMLRKFLFVDVPSVLHHYMKCLGPSGDCDEDDEGESPRSLAIRPRLRVLSFGANLGSTHDQYVNEAILKSYTETKRYYDFPWRFSDNYSRARTEFLMLALARFFSRRPDFFSCLTTIVFNSECINTGVHVPEGLDGWAVAVEIMAGVAYSCPALQTLDLKSVSSLAPECLLYLFYQDAFSLLHKYMYLPSATVSDGKVKLMSSDTESFKHDGKRYCPWCDDPTLPNNVREGCEFFVGETLQVLDDRLYDYVETFNFDECPLQPKHDARSFLTNCVKVSDTVKALVDPVLELKRTETNESVKAVDPLNCSAEYVPKTVVTKSALCSTLRRLLLPADNIDSKTWLMPLVLAAATNLESLGDCLLLEGVCLARDLGLQESLSVLNNISELAVALEDFTWTRTRDKFSRRMRCLQTKHAHWSIFTGQAAAAIGALSLKQFLEQELKVVMESADLNSIKARWEQDISCIVCDFPSLRSLKISVQPSVLCANDRESVWSTLSDLKDLRELYVHSSSWVDTLGLLECLGQRLENLSLTSISSSNLIGPGDSSGRMYLNTVGALCPGLTRIHLGQLKDNAPHAICMNYRFDTVTDCLTNLVHFDAVGNVTLEALQFVWQHAKKLEVLKVSGSIVNSGEGNSEVVLTKDRVEYLFNLNPMKRLKKLNVDMTIASIVAAQTLLDALPKDMENLATMNVKVSIPESLEGQSFGDLVSVILARMASFKSECLAHKGDIVWNWRREGILTILLQQQMLLSFSDLIDP